MRPLNPLARFFVTVMVAGTGLALGLVLLAPQVWGVLSAGDVGDAEELAALGEISQNSLVYARDGHLLAVLHAEENRSPVTLEKVPDHVVNAILDVEDDRFWVHSGVNLRSALRALMTNVESGGVRQGGSTITQQLVKNALLTPEKSVDRKVKEAVLAVRLEDKLSKREILERYLNIVYFGNGAYGIQAAAETYFNTDVAGLKPVEAALLAGILRNPVGYDPVKQPRSARARRDLALERMVAHGHLERSEADELRQVPVPTKVFTPLPPPNDYFVEEVKQRLLDDKRLGDTAQERYNAVFKGGLKITTTLDRSYQQLAEDHRDRVLPPGVTRGKFTSALVSVEPSTGYVRAMVAGDDFANARYNLATQGKRQPGSSFKAFVLLAALEEGHGPDDTIDGSSPCTLKIPGFSPYTPGNYEGSSGGVMSVTRATANSVNCAYARLGADVGLGKVVAMAAKLGLPKDRLDAFPSISLGAEEATPLEMASAYAAIANDGIYHPPSFVEKVADRNGKVLFEGPLKGTRAVSAQTARVATQVLRAVVDKGTGTAARQRSRQVAGKTGTSQEWENAWFVGYTPQLSTAVWMGSPVGNVPMKNVGGRNVTGGSFPARIWGAYTAAALADVPAVSFPAPNPKLIPKSKFIKDKYSSSSSRPKRRRSAPRVTVVPTDTSSPAPGEQTPPPTFNNDPPPPTTAAPPPTPPPTASVQ
ncbi:MAG TPA: PBP1A family penicillin-binding protein [Acidimicrobiales bacterium]|nr:PBP1A family penicillin-binding protein [Acidimicrobiales bacterium]